MPEPLRVLLLEDRADDAELILIELRRAGYDPAWVRVDTVPEYLAQLDAAPEIILADYQLPQFDALLALHLLQVRDLDIPFLIVTGSISEEVAVECMKQGAADYLLKDRLARLGQAVTLSLEKKRLRDAQRRTETALRESELRFRQLVESVRDYAIFMLDPAGRIVTWNAGAQRLLGYWADEVVGQHYSRFLDEDEVGQCETELSRTAELGCVERRCSCLRRDGSRFAAHVVLTALREPSGKLTGYSNVTRDAGENLTAEPPLGQVLQRLAVELEKTPLTSLPGNLHDCLAELVAHAQRLQRSS